MAKQKIFISSVQGEFQNERKQIADYIRHDALLSFYFEPFLFEELPAQDRSAQAAYLEQAAKSEIYLLLLGHGYFSFRVQMYKKYLEYTNFLLE